MEWKSIFFTMTISSQVIWDNKCIKVDNKTIYNFKMSRQDINYVGEISKYNGKPKLWEELKNEFYLQGQLRFMYIKIIHSIPKPWKDTLKPKLENIKNYVLQGHHLIKSHQIYCLNILNSKEIFSTLIRKFSTMIFLKIQSLIGKLYTCYFV